MAEGTGYFENPFTLGQKSPPPSLSLFPDNPMLGMVASLVGRAIGGTDSSGVPFFRLPSFQPDTRSVLDRVLYNNSELTQKYLSQANQGLETENLGNLLETVGLGGLSGNRTFAEFVLPFVNEYMIKSQDPTYGSMLSGIYGAKNQMLPGTGIGSPTPEGDAGALAAIHGAMYKGTWGDNNINNLSFTYGLTEKDMAPLVQRAVASGVYSEEIGNSRYQNQRAYEAKAEETRIKNEVLKPLTREQRVAFERGTEMRSQGERLEQFFGEQKDAASKRLSELEGEAADLVQPDFGETGEGPRADEDTALKMQTFRAGMSQLMDERSGVRKQILEARQAQEERQKKAAQIKEEHSKLGVERSSVESKIKALEEAGQTDTDTYKELVSRRKDIIDQISGHIVAGQETAKEQKDANASIEELVKKFNSLSETAGKNSEDFKRELVAAGMDEDKANEYVENMAKLLSATEKLEDAIELKNKGDKERNDQFDKAKASDADRARVEAAEKRADEEKKEAARVDSELQNKVKENQQNLNRTVSTMTAIYGSAETAMRALDIEYGPDVYKDKDLQDRARMDANRMVAAASEAGIHPEQLGRMRMRVANASGHAMGLSERELNAGWGGAAAMGLGRSAAVDAVTAGYDPRTGKFDHRRYERLAPGVEDRYASAAGSQQARLQVMLQHAAQSGDISKSDLEEYRSMLESGNDDLRRQGIRKMFEQMYGSYEEGMRIFSNNNTINLMRDELNDESTQAVDKSIRRQMANEDAADTNKQRARMVERRARQDLTVAGKSYMEVEKIASAGENEAYMRAIKESGDDGKPLAEAVEARRAQLESKYAKLQEPEKSTKINQELNTYIKTYAQDLMPKEAADRVMSAGTEGRADALDQAAKSSSGALVLGKQIQRASAAYSELDDEQRELLSTARKQLGEGNVTAAEETFKELRRSLGNTGLGQVLDKIPRDAGKRDEQSIAASTQRQLDVASASAEKLSDEEKQLLTSAKELLAKGDVSGAAEQLGKLKTSLGGSGETPGTNSKLAAEITRAGGPSKAQVTGETGKAIGAGVSESAAIAAGNESRTTEAVDEKGNKTGKTVAEQVEENIEAKAKRLETEVGDRAKAGSEHAVAQIVDTAEGGKTPLYPLLNPSAKQEEIESSPLYKLLKEIEKLITEFKGSMEGAASSIGMGGWL